MGRIMPAKNTIKIYATDGIYHIYNRGVEKRTIFLDEYDYGVFLNCLKDALLPPEKLSPTIKTFTLKGVSFKGVARPPKNFVNEIELLAYCLMPNHFHLLIKQSRDRAIDSFMRSIATRYVIYFNKRYKRVGALFQNTYKAILVTEEPYFLHLSRYIHRNPFKHTKNLATAYSSYAEYLGKRHTEWIKSKMILDMFQQKSFLLRHTNTYKKFVEYENEENDTLFKDLTLEEEYL